MRDRVSNRYYHPLVVECQRAGLDEDSAHRLVLASIAAYQFGDTIHWFRSSRREIEREQGSKRENVGYIVRLSLALLADYDGDLFAASKAAGNEWRASIRSQYDERGDFGFHVSIEALVEEQGKVADPHSEVAWRLGLHVDNVEDLFVEEGEDDRLPAIVEAMGELTPLQRSVFEMRVGSDLSWQGIADELGLATRQEASAAYQRAVRSIQRKVM